MCRRSERRRGLACLLAATLSAVLATVAAAQPLASPRVVLRDDAAGEPEFARFKARILAVAEAGDTVTLTALMSPDISAGYEPSTPESVLATYHVTPGRPWLALRDALRLGTVKEGNAFVAPSTEALDMGPDDAIIVASDVRLRAAPSHQAPVVQLLSRLQVVTLDRAELYDADLTETSEQPTGPAAWARVVTADGRAGYVFARLLVSSENSRFVFRRIEGRWKLVALARGAG